MNIFFHEFKSYFKSVGIWSSFDLSDHPGLSVCFLQHRGGCSRMNAVVEQFSGRAVDRFWHD